MLNGSSISEITGTLSVGQGLTLNNSYVSDVSGAISLGTGLTLNEGSNLDLAGGMIAGSVNGSGLLLGYGAIDGTVTNIGLTASSGTLTVSGSVSGGWASITDGATLQLNGASSDPVSFEGGTSTLKLGDPTDFTGWIYGVNPGNIIDLAGISASSIVTNGVSYNGSVLTVQETNGQTLSFDVSGYLTNDNVNYSSDGNGGTDIQWTYPSGDWVSGGTGDWFNSGNWKNGAVPLSATIANASGIIINGPGIATANTLVLDATTVSSLAGALTISEGLTLNASRIGDISGTLTSGTALTIDGGTPSSETALTLNDGSSLSLAGGTITAPQGIDGIGGLENQISGYGTINGAVSGSVALTATSGTLLVSGGFNGWSAAVQSGAVLELGGTSLGPVNMEGGTLKLDDPAGFAGPIFGNNGVIDLAGTQVSGVSYNGVTLTVTETSGQDLYYAVNNWGSADAPAFSSDGHGGTDISWVNTPLSVSSLSVSPGNGPDIENSQSATITLGTTEVANVSGAPALTLSNGGQAVYVSGNGTNTLTFTYTAQPDQKAADVTVTGLTGGTITDQAGNSLGGLAGLDLGLQVEALSPTVTIASAGSFTTDASQTITGTVTAGSGGGSVSNTTVTLFDNGAQVGTATVGTNGAWSANVTLLEGQNNLVAQDTDTAGNVGASSAVTYTLDNTAPTVTITPTGGLVKKIGQTIGGTVTSQAGATVVAGTTVTLYDNGVKAGTATVAADGTWSANVKLSGGANSIDAQDTDVAGLTGTSAPVNYSLDTVNLAMFAGYDASGNNGLWVSDSTIPGTYELTGIANANTAAFDPFNFTQFNGMVLFEGTDANNSLGLWLSNGTAAGTSEVATVGAPNTLIGKDSGADNIAVVTGPAGQLALFNAQERSGNYGLWVTDGTAAGTQELNIKGASPSGIDPLWLTSYGNEAVFDGVDANGNWGLWVTNGTAGGTYELTNIAGASTVKDNTGNGGPTSVYGLAPHLFGAYNGELLFAGFDSSGKDGLWITDGTPGGTQELSASALNPKDFTVLNGLAYFTADDSSGNSGLWMTNGTAAGTHEMTIAGAASSGINPSNLTAFNGELWFQGQDSTGNSGLWVSNGTGGGTTEVVPFFNVSNFTVVGKKLEITGNVNGNQGTWVVDGTPTDTYELTPVNGAAPLVSPAYYTPDDFTASKNGVLFSEADSTGNYDLWVTDGTAAGTRELTIAGASTGANSNYYLSGLAPQDMTSFQGEVLFNGHEFEREQRSLGVGWKRSSGHPS